MKTISVIGLGNRGTEYMGFIKGFHSSKAKIVALCDIRQQALDDFAPKFSVPEDKQFISPESFFAQGVISDALIIATQDASHYEITKQALLTGYKKILLEKPVSGKRDEYIELRDLAEEKGAQLIICHVLRYSGYYAKIIQKYKEIQPDAKFFLVTIPDDCVFSYGKEEQSELINKLAEVFSNCYVIDLYKYAPVIDENFRKKFFMGGHMNPCGYNLIAQMVASYIDYIIRHNMDDFRRVGFIGTEFQYKD